MNISKVREYSKNLGVIIAFFLFLIVCVTLIINFILNTIVINKNFTDIEREQMALKTVQSKNIFQSKIDELENLVQDYAIWDENYNKIQEKNIDKQWYMNNFTEWLPKKYGIDLIVVMDKNKKLITQYGLNNISDILNDKSLMQILSSSKYKEGLKVSGFGKYGGNLYILSASPVFDSNTVGTCQGIVILGRKISPALIGNIKQEFGTDIFFNYDNKFVFNAAIGKEVEKNIKVVNENKSNSIYKLDNSEIIGTLPIEDINGNRVGYMNVIQSRDMFLITKKLTQRNALLAMFLSIFVIMILGLKFKNIVIKPIKNLESQIQKMERENLLVHASVKHDSPNEIINLARSFNHMVDSIHVHKKENEELRVHVSTDFLTSVYNHKYFFESFNKKIEDGSKQIAIMFCDIDKFKLANDYYGHEVGDFILRKTAELIKDEVKDDGMVFRYGGEEFVVMLCGCSCEEALAKAEKIRKSIAKNQVVQGYSDTFPITISIGIASYPKHSLDAAGLIKKSDTAMYYSKQNGRNQCNIYNEDMKVFLENDGSKIDKELLMDSVLALAEAIDAKDNYTGKHSKMVLKYSILLAEKLGVTENEKNKLRIGALLHDCGKIGIPDNIINKTNKLSEAEFALVKNHSTLGYNIIKHITDDEGIIDCVRSHHERWDGKGYPNGLRGESINIFARIVCIADAYHAMISDRSYRKALTKENALEAIIRGKGSQFDPKLVDAFVEAVKEDDEKTIMLYAQKLY